jgi:hypothetical protein
MRSPVASLPVFERTRSAPGVTPGCTASKPIALFIAQRSRHQIRTLSAGLIADGDGKREQLPGAQKGEGAAG